MIRIVRFHEIALRIYRQTIVMSSQILSDRLVLKKSQCHLNNNNTHYNREKVVKRGFFWDISKYRRRDSEIPSKLAVY